MPEYQDIREERKDFYQNLYKLKEKEKKELGIVCGLKATEMGLKRMKNWYLGRPTATCRMLVDRFNFRSSGLQCR